AALGVLERGPKLVYPSAKRSDDALAGDHDAPAPVSVCHVVLSRNSKPGRRPGKASVRKWPIQAAAPEAFVSAIMPFTRSTTDPTVANASTSSFALYGISMPKVSSMSNTITARSSDSISSSLKGVSSVTAFNGSFMFLRRISMILVATSSISLSLPRLRGPCPKALPLIHSVTKGKSGIGIDLKTSRVYGVLARFSRPLRALIANKIGLFWPSTPRFQHNRETASPDHSSDFGFARDIVGGRFSVNERPCGQLPPIFSPLPGHLTGKRLKR